MKCLIIIPAHNEEAALPCLLDSLEKEHPEKDIIVIDDFSTDDTATVARAQGVEVVRLPMNLGIGGAVKTGYKVAHERGYDAAIQFDGDGQHDAKHIDALLGPLHADVADMVIGSRFIENHGFQSDLDRRIGIRIFSMITSWMTGYSVTDVTSGFRVIRGSLISVFATHYPVEFPDAEAIILAARCGMRVQEVPVIMKARSSGVSSFSSFRKIAYPLKTAVSIAASSLRSKSSYHL